MKYEMIALDIDGTLLNMNQEVMPMTKKQLISLQKQGVSVVLSSGRDITSLLEIGKQLDMSHYPQSAYICLNGLEIYDSQKNLLYMEEKFQKEDAFILATIAKEFQFDMILFFESALYILEYAQTKLIDNHFLSYQKDKVHNLVEIPQELFHNLRKVAFIQKEEYIENILSNLHKKIDNQFEVTLVEPDWIEINPKGLNKGHALEVLSHIKKIPLSKVIAFGNGENDMEMLKIAGKGIAMANSFENVKKVADDICGDYNHDGIGKYLMGLYK